MNDQKSAIITLQKYRPNQEPILYPLKFEKETAGNNLRMNAGGQEIQAITR